MQNFARIEGVPLEAPSVYESRSAKEIQNLPGTGLRSCDAHRFYGGLAERVLCSSRRKGSLREAEEIAIATQQSDR